MLNVWRDLHFSRNCLWKTNWNCWPGRPWRASCWFIRTPPLSMKTERPERFNAVASNGYRIRKIPHIRGVLVIIYCLILVAQYLLLNSSRLILVAWLCTFSASRCLIWKYIFLFLDISQSNSPLSSVLFSKWQEYPPVLPLFLPWSSKHLDCGGIKSFWFPQLLRRGSRLWFAIHFLNPPLRRWTVE